MPSRITLFKVPTIDKCRFVAKYACQTHPISSQETLSLRHFTDDLIAIIMMRLNDQGWLLYCTYGRHKFPLNNRWTFSNNMTEPFVVSVSIFLSLYKQNHSADFIIQCSLTHEPV